MSLIWFDVPTASDWRIETSQAAERRVERRWRQQPPLRAGAPVHAVTTLVELDKRRSLRAGM